MGKAVSCSEAGIELLKFQETPEKTIRMEKSISGGGGNAAVATVADTSIERWESLLSKMAVRVLLAEADDSTRQIITALLRKCNYKVIAVSDGLKAWELLKGRPHSIDLILTEVELPSISGYALLTLTMEHHICKNIPVIMMSSNDSVSTVYKCMLRGAVDFLVKPVRKNELRNLWQHVWRKQVSGRHISTGPGILEESIGLEKIEATAENNANSNDHSFDYIECAKRSRECVGKGSDAQSSCTRPESENERVEIENAANCLPQFKSSNFESGCDVIPTEDQGHLEIRQPRSDKTGESPDELRRSDHGSSTVERDNETHHLLESSTKEAIDLIGAFDNCLKKNNLGMFSSDVSGNKFDSFPVLDLCLRRSNPSRSVDQVIDETHRLNHSDASAFSKYKNRPMQPSNSTSPSICNQPKDQETNSERQQSDLIPDCNSDSHGPTTTLQNALSVANIQRGHHEITFPYPQQTSASLSIPANGVRFDYVINPYGSVMPARYCKETGPGTTHCSEPLECQKFHDVMDRRISNAIDQIDDKCCEKSGKLENHEQFSPANDQNGISSGTNVKVNIVNGRSECINEEAFNRHGEASHRSVQREAALMKFRLKRKDRCFEKKVRYESRKKLAEQRPRVKGQFVRQAPSDATPER